MTNAT